MSLEHYHQQMTSVTVFVVVYISLFLVLLLQSPTLLLSQRPKPMKPFSPPVPRPFPPTPARQSHPDYHPPIVTGEWTGPPKMIWNCKLNRQPCELKNGVNFIPFKIDTKTGKETLLADLAEAAQILDSKLPQSQPKIVFKASRLWTRNYLPARYRNACMYLNYAMNGAHPKKMYVMQCNREDVCIYSAKNTETAYTPASKWIDAEIQLDLKYGDARFVLDFEYDIPDRGHYDEMGLVNIRNFSIAYGNCARNDRNECDYPHIITTTSNH